MFRTGLIAAFIALASPALAFDIDAMSAEERESFRAEVRAYLLDNPEVLMEAIAVLEERRAMAAAEAEKELLSVHKDDIFNDGYSWIGGNPDGDVTVVEFLDYRCGFCKRAHPAVQSLLAEDGNVRFIVKEFPILGEESEIAARYAIAVKALEGDAAYEAVHNTLMTWDGAISEGALARISGEAGIADHEAVLAEMDSDAVSEVIMQNRALGQALQINGTPSFIMDDVFVRGFVEQPEMEAIIDDIRSGRG